MSGCLDEELHLEKCVKKFYHAANYIFLESEDTEIHLVKETIAELLCREWVLLKCISN